MPYDIGQNARSNGPKPPFHKLKIPKPIDIQKPQRINVRTTNK